MASASSVGSFGRVKGVASRGGGGGATYRLEAFGICASSVLGIFVWERSAKARPSCSVEAAAVGDPQAVLLGRDVGRSDAGVMSGRGCAAGGRCERGPRTSIGPRHPRGKI